MNHQQPLRTPAETNLTQKRRRERFKQRVEFIKHLGDQGFMVSEIHSIFPEFPNTQIQKIIRK